MVLWERAFGAQDTDKRPDVVVPAYDPALQGHRMETGQMLGLNGL